MFVYNFVVFKRWVYTVQNADSICHMTRILGLTVVVWQH